MADLDTSTVAFLMKLLAEKKVNMDAIKRDQPLSTWAAHEKDFASSRGKEVSIEYSAPQGAGATLPIANATKTAQAGSVFLVPQRTFTMQESLDWVVLQNAANGSTDSEFADALENSLDSVRAQFGNHVERMLWGTGNGVRAVVSSVTGANPYVITVTNKTDLQLIESNQTLDLITVGGARKSTYLVTAMNRAAAQFTVSGAGGAPVATDFIVGSGDGGSLSTVNGAFSFNGIQDICPVTPGTLHGVNQALDRERLAGVYYDASAQSVRAGLINAKAVQGTMSGARISAQSPIFVHPINYAQIETSVEAGKVVAMDYKTTKFALGLEGITIGSDTFVQAPFCPINQAFKIGEGAFVLGTAGDGPTLLNFNAGSAGGGGGSPFSFNQATGKMDFSMGIVGNCYSRSPYKILRVALNPQTAY